MLRIRHVRPETYHTVHKRVNGTQSHLKQFLDLIALTTQYTYGTHMHCIAL